MYMHLSMLSLCVYCSLYVFTTISMCLLQSLWEKVAVAWWEDTGEVGISSVPNSGTYLGMYRRIAFRCYLYYPSSYQLT